MVTYTDHDILDTDRRLKQPYCSIQLSQRMLVTMNAGGYSYLLPPSSVRETAS